MKAMVEFSDQWSLYSNQPDLHLFIWGYMDIVFTNRISARIFKECAEAIVEQRQYTDTPIELRKKVTDCFDVYAEHHQIVLEGMKKGEIAAGT